MTALARMLAAVVVLHLPVTAQREPDLFAARRKAAAGRYGMLLHQFRADEPQLAERHEAGLKGPVARYQGATNLPAGFWVWQSPFWFVFRDGPSTWAPLRPFGSTAVCGVPDSTRERDGASWVPNAADASPWLLLEFPRPVRATSLRIHLRETDDPIARISICLPDGTEVEGWRRRQPASPRPDGATEYPLPVGFTVQRVRIELASAAEVDAVGLEDVGGDTHWASRATASSSEALGAETETAVRLDYPRTHQAGTVLQLCPLERCSSPAVEASDRSGTTRVNRTIYGSIVQDDVRR